MQRPIRPRWLLRQGSIRDVCGYVAGNSPSQHLEPIVDRLRRSREVSSLAADFLALNEAREEADYDHAADFTRPRVRALIARAETSVQLLQDQPWPDSLSLFVGLIALRIR